MRFDYTHDTVGNALTWRQQADKTAVMWAYGYDTADQLTWAVEKTSDAVPTALKAYMYAYDPAGNRTSEQIDDQLSVGGCRRIRADCVPVRPSTGMLKISRWSESIPLGCGV